MNGPEEFLPKNQNFMTQVARILWYRPVRTQHTEDSHLEPAAQRVSVPAVAPLHDRDQEQLLLRQQLSGHNDGVKMSSCMMYPPEGPPPDVLPTVLAVQPRAQPGHVSQLRGRGRACHHLTVFRLSW